MATHETMIMKYLELRDAKEALAKRHKEEMGKYTEAMGLIEAFLKDYLQKSVLQRIGTPDAVAFLHRTRSATVADTGVFREYVISNANFELADMRPKVEAVETYVTEHDGNPPP